MLEAQFTTTHNHSETRWHVLGCICLMLSSSRAPGAPAVGGGCKQIQVIMYRLDMNMYSSQTCGRGDTGFKLAPRYMWTMWL